MVVDRTNLYHYITITHHCTNKTVISCISANKNVAFDTTYPFSEIIIAVAFSVGYVSEADINSTFFIQAVFN